MTSCLENGCSGTYEDGYCNVCGHPQGGSEQASAATAMEAAGPADPGTVAAPYTGVSAIGRLALGSRLHGRTASTGTGPLSRGQSGPTRVSGLGLGQGITVVPAPAPRDEAASVLQDPSVPEGRRFCPRCGHPVGRSRNGRPGRTEGFCPIDRVPFSFTPKLRPGELVAGQYEVAGAIAHGGLGWIYLARDRNVENCWVVLKGLLNSEDPDAMAAAIAERRFLARVDHGGIVKILNFATHEGAGYIVMQYVSGPSLKQILQERTAANAGRPDPLPPDQAVAYILEVLPAFSYLHDRHLVYCDFKPDNLIQVQNTVKLIDLGGVLQLDEEQEAIYSTKGYCAPELSRLGASVASDIFSIGRTLLTLIIDFRGNTTSYAVQLPPQADHPVLARHDSLYQWLLRACAYEREDRFVSCEEMRHQLLGVLREVVAADRGGAARDSHPSTLFRPPAVHDVRLDWRSLPELLSADEDPQLAPVLAALPPDAGAQAMIEALEAVDDPVVELRLRLARLLLETDAPKRADQVCAQILEQDPWEWRAVWLQGLIGFATGRHRQAQQAFNTVYGEVPGEPAPKLALALACEDSDPDLAEQLYLTCLSTDANYVAAAAFGLARIRQASGADPQQVVAAYDHVPPGSRVYVLARRDRAQYLIRHGADLADLESALSGLRSATLEPVVAGRLRLQALERALELVHGASGGAIGSNGDVGADGPDTIPVQEAPLRRAVEQACRALVPLTEDRLERIRLVDRARGVRAWSWT